MKLSVLMPVYNEAATITEIIRRVTAVPLPKELIIVDAGSTDGTRELLRRLPPDVATVLFQERNLGKGAAIRTALEHASGDIVIIQDADLEYDPNDYPALVQPILDGTAHVVYGSRVLRPGHTFAHLRFYLGGRALSLLANLLYGIRITDEPTCYKLFRRELLKSLDLQCRGFEFCPEVTAKVARRGIPIYEIPIHYAPRTVSEGKKIAWQDFVVAVWILVKYRFSRTGPR